MDKTVRITVLVENTARKRNLLAEHGLSVWIEAGGRRILFDTGQGYAIEHNAAKLGIDISTADAIVLSHGHYDHTGGLVRAIALAPAAEVFMHPAALQPKYIEVPGAANQYTGIPEPGSSLARIRNQTVTLTESLTAVAPGISVTGEIPRTNDFEDTGGPFYLDPQCTQPDPMMDDQALVMDSPGGILIILGCAHAGTVNTLEHVAHLTGERKVYAVLGGMHLIHASQERLDRTVDALERFGVKLLGPCHCTGAAPVRYLWARLPDSCMDVEVGTLLELP